MVMQPFFFFFYFRIFAVYPVLQLTKSPNTWSCSAIKVSDEVPAGPLSCAIVSSVGR